MKVNDFFLVILYKSGGLNISGFLNIRFFMTEYAEHTYKRDTRVRYQFCILSNVVHLSLRIGNIKQYVNFLVCKTDLEYAILGLQDCVPFDLNIYCGK